MCAPFLPFSCLNSRTRKFWRNLIKILAIPGHSKFAIFNAVQSVIGRFRLQEEGGGSITTRGGWSESTHRTYFHGFGIVDTTSVGLCSLSWPAVFRPWGSLAACRPQCPSSCSGCPQTATPSSGSASWCYWCTEHTPGSGSSCSERSVCHWSPRAPLLK